MKRRAACRILWGLSFLSILSCGRAAEPAFDPFPAGSGAKYHFDLARNFFSSPEVEVSERHQLIARLKTFQQRSSGALDNPDSLLATFQSQDSLNQEVTRHAAYLELRSNADTRNTTAQAEESDLQSVAEASFAGFDSLLVAVTDTRFTRMQAAQPALGRYRFYIETLRRRAAHPGRSSASQADGGQRFFKIMGETDFGFVQTPAGSLSVGHEYMTIATNPDTRIRRAGYLHNEAGLAKNRDAYADILVSTAIALNKAAKLRGYPDYVAETYDARLLSPEQVRSMLESLARAAEINKRIERTLIDHYRQALKLDTVHVWDLTAPEPGMDATPRFTIKDATRLVLEATRPLGEAYTRELAALLDPANGRLDLAPGPNRANRQGFSTGFVGFPSVFYQGAYLGHVEDLVVLSHESGHAVQNMLMTTNGVLPRYARGPGYFTESFAIFCEFLVLEHLYETAPDKAHKIYYLQQLVTQGAEVFLNGWESLLEIHMFERIGTSTRLSADDIEAMTQSTASRFSVWFGPGSERPLAWLQPTQFYSWPLYRVNYVYSRLLALRYFDLLQRDPAFKDRYMALLMNGYDAPPDTLLQRFVGTNLEDPALIEGPVHVLDSWLKELQTLYGS